MANVCEREFRAKKVTKLALKLQELGWRSSEVAQMPDEEWHMVACLAECAPPNSQETKDEVIAALEASERTAVSQ